MSSESAAAYEALREDPAAAPTAWTAMRRGAPLPPPPDALLPPATQAALVAAVMEPFSTFDMSAVRAALAAAGDDAMARAVVGATQSAVMDDVVRQVHLTGALLTRTMPLDKSGAWEVQDVGHVMSVNASYIVAARESHSFKPGTMAEIFVAAAWCPAAAPGSTAAVDPSLLLQPEAPGLVWESIAHLKNPFTARLVSSRHLLLSSAAGVAVLLLGPPGTPPVRLLELRLLPPIARDAAGVGVSDPVLIADAAASRRVLLHAARHVPPTVALAAAFAPAAATPHAGWLLVAAPDGYVLMGIRPSALPTDALLLGLPGDAEPPPHADIEFYLTRYDAGLPAGSSAPPARALADYADALTAASADGDFLVSHYGGFVSLMSPPLRDGAAAGGRKRSAAAARAGCPVLPRDVVLIRDARLRGTYRLVVDSGCAPFTRLAAISRRANRVRVYEFAGDGAVYTTLLALPRAEELLDGFWVGNVLTLIGARTAALYRYAFGTAAAAAVGPACGRSHITELPPLLDFPKVPMAAFDGVPLLSAAGGMLWCLTAQSSLTWWPLATAGARSDAVAAAAL